jgi:hypothetical protein
MLSDFYGGLKTPEDWLHTEDITFQSRTSMNINLANGQVQLVPVTFPNFPRLDLQGDPGAMAAFLVLRRLSIGAERASFARPQQWQWASEASQVLSINANASNQLITTTFGSGPVPSGLAGGNVTPVALRRIHFGTIPAGVTITKVEVQPSWGATFDDLHFSGTIATNTEIDLGAYYDSEYGLANVFANGPGATIINVRFTCSNTNGTSQTVNVFFWGQQIGVDWAQWRVEYADWTGALHDIGAYDDLADPARLYLLDRIIPTALTDAGQGTAKGFGNLKFTMNNSAPFYAGTSFYNITLNASLAYKTAPY